MSTLTPPQPIASSPAAGAAPARGGLLRVLGVGFGLAVVIGNTIGAGILRTPGEVAARLPDPWFMVGVWVVGGLYALLGAFSISELGAMMPRSGGYYVFTRRALGEFPAFAVGCTDWLAQCATTAAVSIVIGEYTGDLLSPYLGEQLHRFWTDHKQASQVAVAATVTVGMALLQWRGIRWGSAVQNLTSALKALGFVALVVALFALANPQPATPGTPQLTMPSGFPFLLAVLLSMQSVIYAYDGWYGIIYFGEEVRNPGRDVPRSTFGGVALITLIYVAVNLALVYVLPIGRLAGENLAIGTAAAGVFGARADTIVRVLTLISMLSGINAYHLFCSRIPYAMSCDGLAWRGLRRVNAGGTPTVGLLLGTMAAVAFLLTGSFQQVAAIAAFFFVANYTVAYIALVVLRRREPHTPRPYRAWGYPWTTGLALVLSIAFLVAAIAGDRQNSVYALLVLAASYPLYLVSRWLGQQRG